MHRVTFAVTYNIHLARKLNIYTHANVLLQVFMLWFSLTSLSLAAGLCIPSIPLRSNQMFWNQTGIIPLYFYTPNCVRQQGWVHQYNVNHSTHVSHFVFVTHVYMYNRMAAGVSGYKKTLVEQKVIKGDESFFCILSFHSWQSRGDCYQTEFLGANRTHLHIKTPNVDYTEVDKHI